MQLPSGDLPTQTTPTSLPLTFVAALRGEVSPRSECIIEPTQPMVEEPPVHADDGMASPPLQSQTLPVADHEEDQITHGMDVEMEGSTDAEASVVQQEIQDSTTPEVDVRARKQRSPKRRKKRRLDTAEVPTTHPETPDDSRNMDMSGMDQQPPDFADQVQSDSEKMSCLSEDPSPQANVTPSAEEYDDAGSSQPLHTSTAPGTVEALADTDWAEQDEDITDVAPPIGGDSRPSSTPQDN